ncbi:hypothetical protein [Methanolobus profundi]|uniref:Glycosyltransferase RgtA/B/C/D-like domain-containing protein n=1 Tax=Methanolobus profundi TaxID=487685 RepID=A0A1I4RVL2_9EURY|nr:hypothetical protein [Methanolobus profundi]SFM56276.1 hypothetical protein SAMN04488696_1611 [Methanolobus profundi]
MRINRNQILSLLAIVAFFLLIRGLLLLKFTISVGYITNIYSMFPLSFYLGLIITYFIASFLVLNEKKVLGTIILCMNHLEVLLIPCMLGYYSMGRADDMTYIGEYLQIKNSGHIANWDIYPASHIMGAVSSHISNLEPHVIALIIPVLFSFMFCAGAYLFSRILLSCQFANLIAIPSSFILYLGIYNFLNVPHALFFAYMPFYLYIITLYMKSNHKRLLSYVFMFILLTLVLPYSHPFIVFFVFVLFIYYILSPLIFKHLGNQSVVNFFKLNSLLVLIISYLAWFVYQGRLLNDLVKQIHVYINQIGRDPTAIWTAEKLSQVNFDYFDYFKLLIFFYGRYIFPTIFILIGFIFIFHNRQKISHVFFRKYFAIIVLYLLFALIQLILLFNPLIVHQPDRIMNLNFIVYAQIPLFSISLYLIFKKNNSLTHVLLICSILTSIWAISFFGVFDSPNVYRPNVALTNNEIQGMTWFSDSKMNYPINMMFEQTSRYPDIFGFARSNWVYKDTIPDHFGYGLNVSDFSEVYFDSFLSDYNYGYLLITSYGELLYQELPAHKRAGRFNKEDFELIRNDPSINKIYDTLNLDIFIVSS